MADTEKVAQSHVGRRIASARQAMKMSMADLAEKVGISGTATIWRYESGRRTPSVEHLYKFAEAMKVDFSWLKTGAVPEWFAAWKSAFAKAVNGKLGQFAGMCTVPEGYISAILAGTVIPSEEMKENFAQSIHVVMPLKLVYSQGPKRAMIEYYDEIKVYLAEMIEATEKAVSALQEDLEHYKATLEHLNLSQQWVLHSKLPGSEAKED